MQAFVEYVIRSLVNYPDDVQIKVEDQKGAAYYEVTVNPEDMGRVIGRKGVTINAIRSLMTAGASKKGIRCSLSIVDVEDRQPRDN